MMTILLVPIPTGVQKELLEEFDCITLAISKDYVRLKKRMLRLIHYQTQQRPIGGAEG